MVNYRTLPCFRECYTKRENWDENVPLDCVFAAYTGDWKWFDFGNQDTISSFSTTIILYYKLTTQ